MWFLIKGSVFFAMGLVVLSYFSTNPHIAAPDEKPVPLTDTLSALTDAYHYVSALCVQKPDVCEKGAETFTALGYRAKEGARVAFELLDSQFSSGETAKPDARGQAVRQPMPDKLVSNQSFGQAAATGDGLLTGSVPVPLKRPLH
ncbi:DUF5330 domain-containing protein [Rhizobium sp. SGZ-381]|uniref:DUF5330 domain-containing protein n=1 Tax=Rhizobium sp. SGZ-381 TaxID=3342800 RepID=UPI00366E62C0